MVLLAGVGLMVGGIVLGVALGVAIERADQRILRELQYGRSWRGAPCAWPDR